MIDPETGATSRTMYACASTYVALCSIWVLLLALSIAGALVQGTSLDGLVLVAAILAFVVAWVRSFKIELSPDGIHYRSPFLRHARVRWASVASVTSGVRWRATRSPFYMVISSHDATRPLVINIKVFGRPDLAVLATAIRHRSPQAKFDTTTERMSAGQLPSLLRTTSHDERTG